MTQTLKLNFTLLVIIALITALFSSQAISTHAHLAQTHDHAGTHLHEIESHSHDWSDHFSEDSFHTATVDIDQSTQHTNLKSFHFDSVILVKYSFDFDLQSTPNKSIKLTKTPFSHKPSYPPQIPRAPPTFS